MPFDKRHYPSNWAQLRAARLALAGHKCECGGECGHYHPHGRCNAPNGLLVQRRKRALGLWVLAFASAATQGYEAPVRVVLTTAHLDRDKSDDLTRLRSWCQLCHLAYDAAQHGANAAKTRRERRHKGQLPLQGGEV